MKKITYIDNEYNCCMIWDNENYPQSFLSKCNKIVFDQTTYDETNFSEFNRIYILIELKWNPIRRTEFYGFKLAKDLRLNKKILCPIIFYSFMPCMSNIKKPESEILNYPGHYHLQLPLEKPFLNNYEYLDRDILEDINIYLTNSKKLVYDLVHNIKNRCPELAYNVKKNNNKYDKNNIKKVVKDYLIEQLQIFKQQILPEKMTEFDKLTNEINDQIEITIERKDFSPEKLRSPLEGLNNQFYNLLPSLEEKPSEEQVTRKRWQVLFVDDQQYCCNVIEKHFRRNGITCQTAQNAEDAFALLRVDEAGPKVISLIITDFRLYLDGKSETGKWQDIQGYQILNRINSGKNLKSNYAYVMLTSKKGTIEEYIKKQSKFPILWFNKADVLAGEEASFNIFCQRIVEVAGDSFFKKHSIPRTGGWKNGVAKRVNVNFNYSILYKLHIESNDYVDAENKINLKVDRLLRLQYFPEEYVLQPSFNKEDNPDKMLNLFRETILVYRRLFLMLKSWKYSDMDIFIYFNHKYFEKGDDIFKSEIEFDLQVENKRREYSHSLFNSNWGFIKDLKLPNKFDYSIDTNFELLYEEIQFLTNINDDMLIISQEDSEVIVDFLKGIESYIWAQETSSKITQLQTMIKSDVKVMYSDIINMFDLIVSEINNNETLNTNFYGKIFQDFEVREDLMSTKLFKLFHEKIF
ncbi:MAG: hypothetical protein Q8J88_11360 [Bacteroidales bacterium]|nr:hypothetical protein [Bacteroidales bacterium]